jgi:alpha-ketoglutarate-dependent taurine dioxygenase
LKAFALNFGPIGADFPGPPADEVSEMVTTDPTGASDIWQPDATYMAKPNLGAIRRAVRLPPVGRDTCRARMYAVYDALSKPLQETIDDLPAVHCSAPVVQRLRRLNHVYTISSKWRPGVARPSTPIRSSGYVSRPVESSCS